MIADEALVPFSDKAALAAMMRNYISAMAEFVPGIRPSDPYPGMDLYWDRPDTHWPFWLRVDGANAGFALVSWHAEAGSSEMEEFFVADAYRRKGIGLAAARRLILSFPGPWQITQRQTNTPAIAFWHRVLDGFVTYDEATNYTDAVRREQRFIVG